MLREDQRLDSYQNLICSPTGDDDIGTDGGRDGVEHVSHEHGYMEVATIYGEDSSRWDSEEDAERIASDLSAGPGEDDRRRKPRPAHGGGDRNEPGYAHHEGEPLGNDDGGRGRASSGESFEDEADNALFHQRQP